MGSGVADDDDDLLCFDPLEKRESFMKLYLATYIVLASGNHFWTVG